MTRSIDCVITYLRIEMIWIDDCTRSKEIIVSLLRKKTRKGITRVWMKDVLLIITFPWKLENTSTQTRLWVKAKCI